MMKNFFLEFSFVLAIQTNSESGEDVSQIIEPEWFVESVGKYAICIKCPPFLMLVFPLQNKLIIK